jgi:hypothetical protein
VPGKKELSQDQIDVLEEHLPYELNALEAGLAAWASSASDDRDRQYWFRRISAIEAFWVHARILHEFFTKTEVRAASANHFTKSRRDYEIPDVDKVQQQIVHLNYGRPRGDHQDKLDYWFAQRFLGSVDRAVQDFQRSLIEDAQKHWKMRDPLTVSVPPSSPQATNDVQDSSSKWRAGTTGPAPTITTSTLHPSFLPTLPPKPPHDK